MLRRQLLGCSGVRFRAISVPKCTEIGPQSTPEVVDEAIALNKYAGADSEVEKAGCETWGVDFDDVWLFPLHSTPFSRGMDVLTAQRKRDLEPKWIREVG